MPLSSRKALPKINYDWEWEPDELRELKYELANLKCDCPACEQGPRKEAPANKAIQAEQRFNTSDRFIQVTPETVLEEVTRLKSSDDQQIQQCIDLVCPRCMVTMNLLRAAATKVVKDEEIATNTLLTYDKSTGRAFPAPVMKSLLKSEETSIDRPSALRTESASSNITYKDLNDLMSSLSSYDTSTEPFNRQRSRDRVTFLDGYQNEGNRTDRNSKSDETESNEKQCTCLENLIDSIRPPLIGF